MIRTTGLILALLFATFVAADDLATQAEYSGHMTFETKAGVMAGPVAAAPGKQRREFVMSGDSMVTISRFDKGVNWMLMPAQKMYMEHRIGSGEQRDAADFSGYDIQTTMVGPDTVNGVQATKNKVVMTSAEGTKFGGFMWSTNQGVVVKIDVLAVDGDTKERLKMDLTELRMGPQDPQLFEIPAGYSPMNMAGMMKDAMTGMDAPADADTAATDEGAAEEPPQKKKWGWKDALDQLK